jgi:hypothetical protein
MFGRLCAFGARHPFIFGVGLTAAKTAGVDVAVQSLAEKKSAIDWRRTSIFLTFGVVYLGAWQYCLFVKIMPRLVPGAAAFAAKSVRDKLQDGHGLRGLLLQTVVENGINNPLLYFPIFYTIKEYLEHGRPQDGLHKYRLHWREDLVAIWAVWVPAQLINFAFSPMWFRVPFVACVSAGWTAYVSFTRGHHEPITTT